MVTRWLFQPSWACIVLQGCTVGDADVLGAVKDRDLAWKRWREHNKLEDLLCSNSTLLS